MLPITPISHYEIVAFDLYSFSLFNNLYEGKNLLNFRGAWGIFGLYGQPLRIMQSNLETLPSFPGTGTAVFILELSGKNS